MSALVITEKGARLCVRGFDLVLTRDREEMGRWQRGHAPFDTVIIEDTSRGFVTFPALRWMAEEGIVLSLLSYDGMPTATVIPRESPARNARRFEQYQAALDPVRRFTIAKRIVEAKVGHPVPNRGLWSLDTLMLYEATEAERFWQERSVTREHPNSKSPVSAALNFSFALLESRVRAVVARLNLDPGCGFLHQGGRDGKASWVFDLMEPSRACVTDATLAARITMADCYRVYGGTVRLREKGKQRVAQAFARVWTPAREKAVERFAETVLLP